MSGRRIEPEHLVTWIHGRDVVVKTGYVYIMSNRRRTVFYVGVTADLPKRVMEHKEGTGSQFTRRYRCVDLVYYEQHPSMYSAIVREKRLKNWHRAWKLRLIKSSNPKLKDLSVEIL